MKRLTTILSFASRNLVVPAGNILLSYLVIRLTSAELWGSFVNQLIIVTLSAHLLSWGNKEFLLRQFSSQPKSISEKWQQNLFTRIIFVIIPILCLLMFGVDSSLLPWMSLWMIAAIIVQSFEVLILYEKKFLSAALVEATTFGLMFLSITLINAIDVQLLVILYAVAFLFKSIVFYGLFKEVTFPFHFSFHKEHLLVAFPFFLIASSGFLQSKTDLYMVNIFLDDKQVGIYQVMINLFLYVQATAAFIVYPFSKNLYRVKHQTLFSLVWKMTLLGMIIILIAMPVCWLVLNHVYQFQLDWPYFILGALFALPVFIYVPWIYLLFREKQEQKVAVINIAGIGLNVVLNLMLLSSFGMKGALIASVAAQWLTLLFYAQLQRKIRLNAVPGM